MKRVPEIHVERGSGAGRIDRVVWEDESGKTVDLTPLLISRIDTPITPGDTPQVRVTFLACLVEHQADDAEVSS
jgi:hypothetical protein